MTESQMIILGAILVYFAFMILIGLMAGKKQSPEEFVIGSRNVGYIPTIGSLATGFRDGWGVIFWFGFGATVGYGGLWLFLGAIIGLLVYSVIGPRVRKIAKEHGYVTIGEMIRVRMGVITERLTSIIILIFAMMIIAVQLYVSGNLFAEVLQMDAWIGVWSVAIIVGFYLFFGGYGTVVKTDAVQFFLIISLIFIPFFFAPPMEDLLNFKSLFAPGWKDSIAFGTIGLFYVLGSADSWQRVFSARDDKVIRFGFPISGIFLVIMTLSLIFLGMAAKPYLGDAIEADTAFFDIFNGDFIPTPLLAYIAVIVMAICMSTTDTLCYLSAATLAKNFFPHHITDERGNYIKFSRIVMILSLIAMSILALSISDIIMFLFDAASLLFVLAPVYLYTAFGYPKKRTRKMDSMISISIFLSVLIYLYLFTQNAFEDMIMTLVPVTASIVFTSFSIFVVPKISKKK